MKLKTTLTLLLFLVGIYTSLAQSSVKGNQIKGRLIDSLTRSPAEFVTVSLKLADNQQTKTVVSKIDGTFIINDVDPGKHIISFTLLGYTGKSMEVATDGSKPVDLGDVPIKALTTQIGAVSIKANRQLVKQEADRISYDIQSDPVRDHWHQMFSVDSF